MLEVPTVNSQGPQYWLTLDLSTSVGGICLHQVSPLKLLSQRKLTDKFKHSEQLMGALDEVLRETGLSLGDISQFITTLGPGSYTGLRIALTTLKGLSFAHATPVAVFPSHECRYLAWSKSKSQVHVLTTLSATSAHLAKYEAGNLKEEVFGTVEELSKESCDELISEAHPFQVEDLATYFSQSKQKKIATSWSEIQRLTPEYWGSKYRTIADAASGIPSLPVQS